MFSEVRPVTWPEIEILSAIHGRESVTDVVLVKSDDNDDTVEEKARLLSKYGKAVVEHVFPGFTPRMEVSMPKPRTRKKSKAATPEADAEIVTEADSLSDDF